MSSEESGLGQTKEGIYIDGLRGRMEEKGLTLDKALEEAVDEAEKVGDKEILGHLENAADFLRKEQKV